MYDDTCMSNMHRFLTDHGPSVDAGFVFSSSLCKSGFEALGFQPVAPYTSPREYPKAWVEGVYPLPSDVRPLLPFYEPLRREMKRSLEEAAAEDDG